MTPQAWNHNTHFHAQLLDQLPRRVDRALDVGCGDGSFAAELSRRAGSVLALDADPEQVKVARARCANLPNVLVQQVDFLTAALPSESFDVVALLAVLHHVDLDRAAAEARRVLAPGGTLLVLGVWTDTRTLPDLAWNLASVVANLVLRLARGRDVMSAPSDEPQLSLPETRARLADLFPGAVVRRHVLWRYTLVWRKP